MRKFLLLSFLVSNLCGSIPPSALIYTKTGYIQASSLGANTELLTFNCELHKNKLLYKKAHLILKLKTSSLCVIKTESGDITVSEDQLIYDVYKNAWVQAGKLDDLSSVFDSDFRVHEVISVENISLKVPIDTYAFYVDQTSCFYISDTSGNKILIHNGWPATIKSFFMTLFESAKEIEEQQPGTIREIITQLGTAGLIAAIPVAIGAYAIDSAYTAASGKRTNRYTPPPAPTDFHNTSEKRNEYRKRYNISPTSISDESIDADMYCRQNFPNDDFDARQKRAAAFSASKALAEQKKMRDERYARLPKGNIIVEENGKSVFVNNDLSDKELHEVVNKYKNAHKDEDVITNRDHINALLKNDDWHELEKSMKKVLRKYRGKRAPKDPKNFRNNSVDHVFTDKEGHLPKCKQAEKIIRNISSDESCFKGVDDFGNKWYECREGESQYWARVRDNKIVGGGRNKTPIEWDAKYGFRK